MIFKIIYYLIRLNEAKSNTQKILKKNRKNKRNTKDLIKEKRKKRKKELLKKMLKNNKEVEFNFYELHLF